MRVGFIGLGAMGRPMAKRLLASGVELGVFDVVAEAVSELAALGAVPMGGVPELASWAETICLSLPNSAIIKNVFGGQDGLITNLKKDDLVIDLSTIEPEVSQQLAAGVESQGALLVDAPVSGGSAAAEAGRLTIMVGGSSEAFERAKTVLEFLAKKIFHVGPIGSGQAIKLVNNHLLGCNMVATAEALTLGKKLGLDTKVMLEVISSSSGANYALTAKAEKFIFAGNFVPGFAVDLQYKDLELAASTARSLTLPQPMGATAIQVFQAARAKGLGREDISAIIKLFEALAGVEVRSEQ
jgi:3-hydroxyisobutyrate dehydrogenase